MTALLLLLLSPLASAADHELDLTVGVDHIQRQDELMSPRTYRGTGPAIAIGWTARGDRLTHKLNLGVELAKIRSQQAWEYTRDGDTRSTHPTNVTFADLQYAVGGQLGGERWSLDLGGTVAGHFEALPWDYGHYGGSGYVGAFEFAPWANLRLQLAKGHSLDVEGWTPAVTWLSRSPYALHDGEYIWHNRDANVPLVILRYIGDGRVVSPVRYAAGHLRLRYAIDLHPRWALLVSTRLDAYHAASPRPATQLQLGASAGLRGRF
ncbi:MAG: hypothetical protein KC912_09095 [Proteobacteria bacterium]|nr:hypothetical protein [Pseudomonadota bacterium]